MSVEIRSYTGVLLLTVQGADLQGADLRGAYLQDAYLQGADLQGADLQGADLRGANLRGAYLQGANLQGAYLQGADPRGAYLQDADLRGANLRGADLQGADLRGAYLQGAYLRGANLRGADLQGAKGVDLVIAQTRILPDSGELVVWKKAAAGRIVQLRIPADARRSHGAGRKCRAERAEVVAIFDADGSPADQAFSTWDAGFRYIVGATVEPTLPFDTNMWNECSSGIHFYITRLEAENHV